MEIWWGESVCIKFLCVSEIVRRPVAVARLCSTSPACSLVGRRLRHPLYSEGRYTSHLVIVPPLHLHTHTRHAHLLVYTSNLIFITLSCITLFFLISNA